MKIHQIPLGKMANFTYIVEDETTHQCVLVDPAFEVKRILREVEILGLSVVGLINTHCHSDHTAGNRAVVEATGAPLMIHRDDAKALAGIGNRTLTRAMGGKGSPKPSRLLKDGSVIEVGKSILKVLHTPGHTHGGICLYAPGHVITGDTLFVGGVGRTDLPGGSLKVLKRSLREKIFTLPENTVVWPGHDYGKKTTSTVGREKATLRI
ncbi:MBL fold metallo-hydrolase [Desulfoluna sp.]|uniref:MBL fold metallo-hydrolase n=1 Tax=Desulfoluna sp. TaxID=2045199 RepID=UPI0026130A7A|nr:MBL fold metallo-hydrolase [Desulfoluna sp.]